MKKALISIIILIGAAVVYYLFFLLPAQTEHKLVMECRSLGEKIQKEIVPERGSALDPEFYYNPKLKKCFFCGGYVSDGMVARFIIDAYTNKEIIGSLKNLHKINDPTIAEAEMIDEKRFENKKQELFN